jgi:hypothetical protein
MTSCESTIQTTYMTEEEPKVEAFSSVLIERILHNGQMPQQQRQSLPSA